MPQTYKGVTIPSYADPADGVVAFQGFVDAGGGIGQVTTATRPAAPQVGHTIYNTTEDRHEVFNGSGWVPLTQLTAYNMNVTVISGDGMTFVDTDCWRSGHLVSGVIQAQVATDAGAGFLRWDITGLPRMHQALATVCGMATIPNGGDRRAFGGLLQITDGNPDILQLRGGLNTGEPTAHMAVGDNLYVGFTYVTND